MKRVAVLLTIAITALAATASAASAHEFIASKTGKISVSQSGHQLFYLGTDGVLIMECEPTTATGEITALKSAAIDEALTFSGCEGNGGRVKWETPLQVEFKANGAFKILSPDYIQPATDTCEFMIPEQTVESAVKYKNLSEGKLAMEIYTSGVMRYLGTGGACGGEGTMKWDVENYLSTTLAGGTLKWE